MAKSTGRTGDAGRGRGAGPDTARPDTARPDTQAEAGRIIEAAFARIASEGWRRLSLAAIAAEAGLPILRVYRVFRSKQAILCGFVRRIDAAVLAEPPAAEEDERPRDRLFDLLMRRFDALRPYRPALAVLRREFAGDPLSALAATAALARSMRWMLEAADIPTAGLRGAMAVKLTGAAYLAAMRVWRGDDSPDLAQTMAALDARLRRIERCLPRSRPMRHREEPVPA